MSQGHRNLYKASIGRDIGRPRFERNVIGARTRERTDRFDRRIVTHQSRRLPKLESIQTINEIFMALTPMQ